MTLVVNDLAKVIADVIDARDVDGNKIGVTTGMKVYAQAIISSLQTAPVSNLPGTVVGTTISALPLQGGAASNGLAAVVPTLWNSIMTTGFPTSKAAAISLEASASTTYLSGATRVSFSSGKITGTCTSVGPPSPAPGPLVAGAGFNGTVGGLSGRLWAAAVTPPTGDLDFTTKLYNAIANYIQSNAVVNYATGTITGTCPPTAGPLQNGTGVGGKIS